MSYMVRCKSKVLSPTYSNKIIYGVHTIGNSHAIFWVVHQLTNALINNVMPTKMQLRSPRCNVLSSQNGCLPIIITHGGEELFVFSQLI